MLTSYAEIPNSRPPFSSFWWNAVEDSLPGVQGALGGAQLFDEGFNNVSLNNNPWGVAQVGISLAPAAFGGAGSGLGATLPSTTASTLIVGETPVIGGLQFTSGYSNLPGYTTLNAPSWNWQGVNVPWLNQQIATGQSFVVGPGGFFTNAEINYLTSGGYQEIRNLLVPLVL